MQEAGNEIGSWRRNLSIKTPGAAPYLGDNMLGPGQAHYTIQSARIQNFDYGWEGVGFWLHGAGQIAGEDNISTSAASAGFALFGNADGGLRFRDIANIETRLLPAFLRDISRGLSDPTKVEVSAVPLRQLKRLVAYNTNHFFHVWGHLRKLPDRLDFDAPEAELIPYSPHRSLVEDFLGWELRDYALRVEYSSSYTFRDGLLVAERSPDPASRISPNKINGHSITFENIVFDGFNQPAFLAVDLDPARGRDHFGVEYRDVSLRLSRLPVFTAYGTDFGAYAAIADTAFLVPPSPHPAPSPAFTAAPVGGLALRFDASVSESRIPGAAAAESRGVAAYAWDFDGDGSPDKFGRVVHHYFPSAGPRPVTLTVWDANASAATLTQTVTVSPAPYPNPFRNADISSPVIGGDGAYLSADYRAPFTWLSYRANAVIDGALRIDSGFLGGAAQIAPDNRMRRGPHTFSLRARSQGNAGTRFHVRLYGIQGEFSNPGLPYASTPGPAGQIGPAGIWPHQATALVNEDLGGNIPEWRTFTWDIDLAHGYDLLLVQISAHDPASLSTVLVDDIALLGPGTPVLPLPPAANQPPEITLDLPARAPARFTLVADARDPDGSVAKVEFFDGPTKIGETTSAPFTWTVFNAAPGMHEYTARATDDLGATALAPERYTQVIVGASDPAPAPVSPPAAPSGLAATPASGTRIDLSWTDNSADELGFELERRLLPAGAFVFVAYLPPDSTTHADTGLPGGTAYEYRIRSVNTTDPSPYSATATATTWATLPPPTFAPAPGSYDTPRIITLTSPVSGVTLRYTTDGSTPTATTGTLYTGPFTLSASATLRARAFKPAFTDSATALGDYLIAEPLWQGLLHDNNIPARDSAASLQTSLQAAGYTVLLHASPPATLPSRPLWWSGAATYAQLSGVRNAYTWSGLRWSGSDRVGVTGDGDGRSGEARVTLVPYVPAPATRKLAFILTSTTNGLATARLKTIRTGSVLTTFDRDLSADAARASVGEVLLRVRPGEPIEITFAYGGQWGAVFLAFQDGAVTPLVLTPFEQWRQARFTPAQLAEPLFSGDAADPDGDGLANLLEYALDLDPLSAASATATITGLEPGTGRLSLTFRRARPATELTYVVEGSSDIVSWRAIAINPFGNAGVGLDLTVSDAPLPTEDQTRRFLRLRVTQSP
jgi:hypothetical protein